MHVWLVRTGKTGENDSFCVDNSVSIIGWERAGDLSPYHDWESISQYVQSIYPQLSRGAVSNYTGQLFSFAHRIEVGDYVVVPLRTSGQIAIGIVKSPYRYVVDQAPNRRHQHEVEWKRTDVPRTAIKQDLLYSLGAFMTVCEIKRNDAMWRIEQIAETGIDPGSRTAGATTEAEVSDLTEPEAVDIVEAAGDRLRQFIIEEFAGHDLAYLVSAVLEAEGFTCDVSPAGPDGGIDILAGRGPLGLDSPRLIVQVKSQTSPVDAPTVRQLHGVISTHGADQGLLVAWGGVNKVATSELATQRFNLRVWDADHLIESVCQNYDRLPDTVRSRLPLRQIWTVDTGETGPHGS